MDEKLIALVIFITCYSLVISRKFKLSFISLTAAFLLFCFGIVSPRTAIFEAIKWDVLAIYWGFMMISMIFSKSKMPALIANKIIKRAKKEKYVILFLCAITALLSAFMENVGVVLMMAPVAIESARKLKSNLFPYIVAIAISSNIVTTLTMIADPPSIILALETGMKFFDFYWFQGKLSLGAITFFGAIAALLSLLYIFRKMKKNVETSEEKIEVDYLPSIVFLAGILALAVAPYFELRSGIVGIGAGLTALAVGKKDRKGMLKDFDWNSFFFIVGIFIIISSLEITGLLDNFVNKIADLEMSNGSLMLAIIIWISVAVSSFMDNVPYTVLMIPICIKLAAITGANPFLFLFGMLIGTGIGGSITPVGATANVFACGILEKEGYKIKTKDYMKISLPFTIIAVLVCHLLLQILWG